MSLERTRVTESRHAVARYMHFGNQENVVDEYVGEEWPGEPLISMTIGELVGELDDTLGNLRAMIEQSNEPGMFADGYTVMERALALLMNVLDKCGLPSHPDAARSFALGVYSEQEGSMSAKWETSNGDRWRDEPLHDPGQNTDILRHLEHELEEIKRNMQRGELDYLLHNAADLVGQTAILRARAHADLNSNTEVE